MDKENLGKEKKEIIKKKKKDFYDEYKIKRSRITLIAFPPNFPR